MLKKIILLILSVSSVFAMHNAELNINEYDLEAGIKLDMGQFNHSIEPDTTFFGVSVLKASEEHTSPEGADIGGHINFDFFVKQDIQNTGFKVGLGIKGVYSSVADVDSMALPIGAELSYKLPLNSVIPIGFSAIAHYAPKSLSFLDASNYIEYRFQAFVQLMDKASIFAGFRNIEIEFDNNDFTYNESVYFGIKFSF